MIPGWRGRGSTESEIPHGARLAPREDFVDIHASLRRGWHRFLDLAIILHANPEDGVPLSVGKPEGHARRMIRAPGPIRVAGRRAKLGTAVPYHNGFLQGIPCGIQRPDAKGAA